MIMDDEDDMWSTSASDHADNRNHSSLFQLWSMTALHASPLFFVLVQ